MAECPATNDSTQMELQRYLKNRRPIEVIFWLLFALVTLIANIAVIAMDYERTNNPIPLWEPIAWETSSILALLALIPLLLLFDTRFPLRWATFPTSTLQHLGFSVLFSILHVAMMVGIRKVVYWFAGSEYSFGNIPLEWFYEYLKDIRTYFLFIALIYLYRFMLLRLQGEASLLAPEENSDAKNEEQRPERLLVRKLGREFLIHTRDIDYIEAAGNYVNIRIGERSYPLRNTMTNIARLLDDTDFKRVHRSYIVNLNRIREIQPLESGDALITLVSDQEIPMSRTYRNNLNSVF